MAETQLELFPREEWEIREEKLKSYKKEVFNSFRGLYARSSEINKALDKIMALLKEGYNIQVESKVVVFESDVEEVVESLIVAEKEFLNAELLEYKKLTESGLNSLKFKYNESERQLLRLEKVLMNAVFKEMENRAQA